MPNASFNYFLTLFIVPLYIKWHTMFTSQQGKEETTLLVNKLLYAIADYGKINAPTGKLNIQFTLSNPDNCWGGMEEMDVIAIDFVSKNLIIKIFGEKLNEIYYPEFGTLELISIVEHLEQFVAAQHNAK